MLTTRLTKMILESWHTEEGWYFILPKNIETKSFYSWCRKNLHYRTEQMPPGSETRIGIKTVTEEDAILVALTWS